MLKLLKTQSFLTINHSLNPLKKTTFQNTNNIFKTPRRNFSNNYNEFFNMIPPVTRFILCAHAFIYGIGFFMSYGNYIKTFFYHSMALNHQKYHVLLTCHFTKGNTFDFLFECFITFFIGRYIETTIGSKSFMRIIAMSVEFGNLFLLTLHKGENDFLKSDAILRGVTMSMFFMHMNTKFMLFPIPVNVPGWALGGLLFFMDYMYKKWVDFGGYAAALMYTQGYL